MKKILILLALFSNFALAQINNPTFVGPGGRPTTFTNHGVLVGKGTANATATAAGTSGQCLTSNGPSADPTYQTCGAGGTGTVNSGTAGQMTYYATTGTAVSGTPNVTVNLGDLFLGILNTTGGQLDIFGATSGDISIIPQAAAGTYNFNLPTSAGTSGQALLSGGGGSTAQSYGTLAVPAGGTGAVTLTAHGILLGEGTSAIGATAAGTAGQCLLSNGPSADATFQTCGSSTSANGLNSATTTVNVSAAAAPTSGQVITATSGTSATWQTPAGGSNYVVETTTYGASSSDYILADTTSAAFTITLPAAPAQFARICFIDAAGTFNTNTLTINPNSLKIMGSTSNMTVTTQYANFCLVYYTSGLGWRIGN